MTFQMLKYRRVSRNEIETDREKMFSNVVRIQFLRFQFRYDCQSV